MRVPTRAQHPNPPSLRCGGGNVARRTPATIVVEAEEEEETEETVVVVCLPMRVKEVDTTRAPRDKMDARGAVAIRRGAGRGESDDGDD